MNILSVLLAVILLVNANLLAVAQGIAGSKAKQNNASRVAPRSRYLQANGIRIHYLEWNPGGDSTIILLHGLYDSADTWAAIAPLLARGYRVIALDRRGAGLTEKPDKGYDFQTLAEDVLSVINKLKLQRVRVVGHSAGAGVALTVAATEPAKIHSVVLIDGGFWAKRAEPSAAKPASPCNARPVECKRSSAIERGSMDYDSESLYSRVSVPALLILGIPPKSESEQFARELQEARSHVEKVAREKLQKGKIIFIRETSHWIQRDQPNELSSVIKDFFNSSTKRALTKN